MRHVVRAGVLLLVWFGLWGRITPGNVVGGVLVVAAIYWIFPTGPGRLGAEHAPVVHLLAALKFLVLFAWALLVATAQVVAVVLRPRLRVAEGIVEVPLTSTSPVIATMVANAITLPPGTMTVDVFGTGDEPAVLYVHVLDLDDAESIRDDGRTFEALAVNAFGSRGDRERLGGRA